MLTNLERWLAHYDPLTFGATRMGLLGSVLAQGKGPGMPGGLTVLFRGSASDAIDTDTPVGAAGPESASITVRPGVEVAAGTHFFQAIPYGPGGFPAVVGSPPQIVEVIYDEFGAVLPLPPGPRHLRVAAIAGGRFKLQWSYLQEPSRPRAARFNVYSDGGGGTVDYENAVGTLTVSLRLNGEYAWIDETGYADGTAVKFGVRSETADDREEENTNVATGIADDQAPAEAEITDYTELDDE